MKNSIALLMLCLLSATILYAQAKTDRERDGLRGLVQTIKVWEKTVVTDNEAQTKSFFLMTHGIPYDRAGYRMELALYDKNGVLSRRITYAYDAATKKLSELTTYDARNVMIRKIVDTYRDNKFKSNRVIYDYNEDGTFYRKTMLTYDPSGELNEVADYRENALLIKKDNAPFKQHSYSYSAQNRLAENDDRIVSFGQLKGEYFDVDNNGNWTRGTSSTSSTYSSGRKVKTEKIVRRELTYYQ